MIKKDFKISKKLLYVLFALLLFFIHSFIITGTNDDAWFAEILEQYELRDFLISRYHSWSSRLPIEMGLVFLTRVSPWIWKLLNTLIILLLVYECSILFGKTANTMNTGLFMLLVLLIPAGMLNSAGWIATTLNYLWPITIGIFALLPIHRWEMEKKITWWEFIIFYIACILGGFQEQMAAVLFAIYALYAGYRLYHKKRLPVFWFILFLTLCALLFFILACPGNANRSLSETERWFPEFAYLTFFQKILIGCLNTFSYYVSCGEFNTIFLLFSYVLFIAVCFSQKNMLRRSIALYPFLVTFLWGYVGRVVTKLNITTRIFWLGLLQNEKLPEQGIYSSWHLAIECFIFLTVICAVIFALFGVFGKTPDFCVAITILLAALCSRIILGFSSTVYISGSRTATLGFIGFMILTYLCIQKTLSLVPFKNYCIYFMPCYLFSLASNIILVIAKTLIKIIG